MKRIDLQFILRDCAGDVERAQKRLDRIVADYESQFSTLLNKIAMIELDIKEAKDALEFYGRPGGWHEIAETIDLRETTAIFHAPEKILEKPIREVKTWRPAAKTTVDRGQLARETLVRLSGERK